jgi:flagellar biosynthetic protein FliR
MTFASISADQIQLFLLAFTRISAMLVLMPIFGSANIPLHLKMGLSFMMSLIVFPLVKDAASVAIPLELTVFTILLMKELLAGMVIGFAASLLFAAVQGAGELIDTEMGFGFAQLVDPYSETLVSLMGQFKTLVYTTVFLVVNAHFFILLAIVDSFRIIPLLGVHAVAGPLTKEMIMMAGQVLVMALKLAAPVYITMILSSLTLGIVARAVPQINVFFEGLPVKIVVGLGCAMLALPMTTEVFRHMINGLVENIWRLLYLMA